MTATEPRYRRPRPAPPPDEAAAEAALLAALDAKLLGLLARRGGAATLRRLFDRHRDPAWFHAAPLWALAAARRLDRAGLAGYDPADDFADVTLTLTPAGRAAAAARG